MALCEYTATSVLTSKATFDYVEERVGLRASTLGEVPYFDANSKLRSEALKEEGPFV